MYLPNFLRNLRLSWPEFSKASWCCIIVSRLPLKNETNNFNFQLSTSTLFKFGNIAKDTQDTQTNKQTKYTFFTHTNIYSFSLVQEPSSIVWLLCSVNSENRKTSPLIYNHGQKSWDTFAFVELLSINTYPAPLPTPQTTLDTSIKNFSEFQHCVVWGNGELQEKFEKDARFNEGTQKLPNILNTALLSQEFLSRIEVIPYLSEVSNFPGIMWVIVVT